MLTKFVRISICLLAIHGGFLFTAGAHDILIPVDPLPRAAVLSPTTNAPAIASGLAWIGSPALFLGTNGPDLHVTTEFLSGGVYSVSITDNESNSYTLGTFSVPTFTNHIYAYVPVVPPIAIAVPVGEGNFTLPDGLNATNVVGISIADSNAVVDLTGTFPAPFHIPPPPMHEVTLLSPTNDAPVNATGRAALDTDDAWDSTNGAIVTVEAIGLPAGPYTVTVTDNTGTNTFVLGTLDETVRSNRWGFVQPLFLIDGQSNTTGLAEFPLPDGLAPTNAVTVSIIDSNDVVELIGNFVNPTNRPHCWFNTASALIPGPLCTNLHGDAQLQLNVTKGKANNKFSLVAQGGPADETLTILVNGVSVGTTKSNKHGQIKLHKLPQDIDLESVMSVEADDSHSNVVFSVSF